MAEPIKFAIIGYGHIGKHHAAIIRSNPQCRLIAICDMNVAESEKPGDDGIPFFRGIEELLQANPDFDVAVIATPNGLHEAHALTLLGAGKHVLVEKPMALSVKGCNAMIAEAQRQQKKIFCVMQNRYSPPVVWLKDLVQKDIPGKLYFVQVNCFWNRDQRYYTGTGWHGRLDADGGTLFTQFSHFIDLLYWLFGDITPINAVFNNFAHKGMIDFEDSGSVIFRLSNGGAGNLNYTTAVYKQNLESNITIIAENGTIKIGGQYMDEVLYCDIKDYTMPALPKRDAKTNHALVISNLVDVLEGRVEQLTNAIDGMKVVDIIERTYALDNSTA